MLFKFFDLASYQVILIKIVLNYLLIDCYFHPIPHLLLRFPHPLPHRLLLHPHPHPHPHHPLHPPRHCFNLFHHPLNLPYYYYRQLIYVSYFI